MKTILLPTDFSENSWNAIKYAIRFFNGSPCSFYLLHVNRLNNFIEGDKPYLPTRDFIEDLYIKPSKKALRAILKRISSDLDLNPDHKFYTLTDYGFFIESIRKHVAEKKIDLIIMGTKGATGLRERIVGSNTGDVITKVKCTTLVVPEEANYQQLKEIAFPTDFALSYGMETLQPLSELLADTKAFLRILHISKREEELNDNQKANKELLEDYFDDIDHDFHFLTNKKVEDAVQCFVESRGIDMITMVAKNLNYFQQILFHSKVEKISYHIEVPFLVLHE